MKKKIVCIVLLCCLTLVTLMPLSAFANSAPVYWWGSSSSDTILIDENCPIEVKHELLRFDIQDFPEMSYNSSSELIDYDASVTATYKFYNPTDSDITTQLAFPIGNVPEYINMSYEEFINSFNDKYAITVDNQTVEKDYRYTYCPYIYDFTLSSQIDALKNEYIQHEFYTQDLTVTIYTFEISDVDNSRYDNAFYALDVQQDDTTQRIIYFENSGGRVIDNKLRIGNYIYTNEQKVELIVFGQPYQTMPQWTFYKDGAMQDNEQINGAMTLKSTNTYTLEQFAINCFDADSPISMVDRYNIVLSELSSDIKFDGFPALSTFNGASGYQGLLMVWYSYQITVPSKQTLTNSVTAPLFPQIDNSGTLNTYKYTYLLSPATRWAEFYNLDVVFNCPYFFVSSNLATQNGLFADGYQKHYDSLPTSQLYFELRATPKTYNPINITLIILIVICVLILLFYVAVLTVAIILLVKLTKKKSNNKNNG